MQAKHDLASAFETLIDSVSGLILWGRRGEEEEEEEEGGCSILLDVVTLPTGSFDVRLGCFT
jgi:hypothetical protein